MHSLQFSKKFPLRKNGDHFEWRFRQNYQATGYLTNVLLAIFKNFPPPTYGGHFEFSKFSPKWKNTKLLLSP